MHHIEFNNFHVKFRRVLRQQTWGEVVVLIPPSSAADLRIEQWKNY